MDVSARRSSIEIIGDILRIKGSKTAVMYQASLSYSQTQKYLDILLSHSLLELTKAPNGRPRYMPTERGQKLLGLIEAVEMYVQDLPLAARAP